MRIRFLSDQVYETEGPGKGPRFAKGYVLDEAGVAAALGLKEPLADGWAEGFLYRWVQRGVAVDDDAQPVDPPQAIVEEVSQVQKLDLSTLTRAELDELAGKRGVDITEAKNKGDVIAALELAAELGDHND